jgi:site-specific DNA-methyltransferase (cytosine-N4-specific)
MLNYKVLERINMGDTDLIGDIIEKQNTDGHYWDFKKYYRREHLHGIGEYPATMVPKMQSELLDIFLKNDKNISNILDPFMGSGTVLMEGICRSLNTVGIDVNPLSYLLVKVKTTYTPTHMLDKKIMELFNRIDDLNGENAELHHFEKIEKWFRNDIIQQLSVLRKAIMEERSLKYRRIFWITLCQIVRKSCNSRRTTFKLHIKKRGDILNFKYDCITEFKKQCIDIRNRFDVFNKTYPIENRGKATTYLGDVIYTLNRKIENDSIDLIFTSPPYGDNHTTVTYGQYSYLQLKWINPRDVSNNTNKFLETQTGIDKNSLGGVYYSIDKIENSGILDKSKTLHVIYNMLLKENETNKARKVASFYMDFDKSIESCFKVLKPNKYALFITGNRVVNGRIIEFNKILEELANHHGAKLVYDFKRNILYKKTKTRDNDSIKKEDILIFKKI